MKKLLLILFAINTTIFSIFSMENDNNLWSRITIHLPGYDKSKKAKELLLHLNSLPKDMQNLIEELVVTRALVSLIKDYAHNSQIFFKKLGELMFINKVAAKVVRFYIPACTNSLDKFDADESLLIGAADRDWERFWCLILQNKNLLKNQLSKGILRAALLNFAINKNKNMVDIFLNNGAKKYHADFGIFIKNNSSNFLHTLNAIDFMDNELDNRINISVFSDDPINSYAALKISIKNGFDIKANMRIASPYLFYNSKCNYYGKIVKLFIKNGINLDITDINGRTPLMCAVIFGNENRVKFLIENGADVNLQDTNGFTALSLANRAKFENIIRLLIANGAH